MNKQVINIGDTLTLSIKRLGINGEGIAYYKKLAIFVKDALPGEIVDAAITEVFHNRAIAKVDQLKKESKHRVEPFCPVYEACGGCQLQHLAYDMTLVEKRSLIVQAFERYVPFRLAQDRIKKTIGMESPTHYRNKAQLPVRKTKRNKIGMYAADSKKFVPIKDCPIQAKEINKVLHTILDLMEEIGVDAFDTKYRKGYITNIIVRIGDENNVQVTFTCRKTPDRLPKLAASLMQIEPIVKSVFMVLDKKGSRTFFNDSLIKIAGEDDISAHLNEHVFKLEPASFFQLNTIQANVFFTKIREMAKLCKDDIAIDAYAGSAPISHYIANDCKKVYAIEVNEASVKAANQSLKENHISNVEVIKDTFEHALKRFSDQQIDVMFFDPPRVGLGEETIRLVKQIKPKRIIYGSCNPSTLAKDIALLVEDYVIEEVTPIDMFPFTAQVESVTLLTLKND